MKARLVRALLPMLAGAVFSTAPALLSAAAPQQSYTPEFIVAHLASQAGESLGPPGGEVRSLVRAAANPDRLFLGTATGHVYRSEDGGSTWDVLPLELSHEAVVDNLLVHAGNADIVYAAWWTPEGTGGLSRSHDGGITWAPLPVPASPSLRAIAVAPSRLRTMYVGGIGGVWRSDDAGDTWRTINGPGLATEFIESLAVDPRDPEHVYAGTWRQVYRSRDGGERWARIYQGMAIDRDIFSLAISPHDPDTILAGTCNFLYRSGNGGGTWGERRSGLATDHNRVHTIVHDPHDPQVIYAGTRGALYRSANAGDSWTVILAGVSVSAVVLDDRSGRLLVATEERGILAGFPGEAFVESNAGLTSARVVAFDALPGAPRVLFAARADGPLLTSLHYSTDIGLTWKPLGVAPPTGEIRVIRAQAAPVNRVVVVDSDGWWGVRPGGRWQPLPAAPGELAALEIAHDAGGTLVAATSEGLFAADPHAMTGTDGNSLPFDADVATVWRPLWTGGPLTTLAVQGTELLAVGPAHAVAGPIAPLGHGGDVLRVSTPTGIDEALSGVALAPEGYDSAYAIGRHDVYRSDDSGATWTRLPLPWPAAELRAIAVDPANPDQVLALDYRGAIYRGHARGAHWLVLDEDPGLYRAWTLRVSSQAPGYALVATQGHGLRVVPLSTATAPAGSGH